VIVTVAAVTTRRPLINQRKSRPNNTRRENKKIKIKRKQLKRKGNKQKRKMFDLIGLPQ
jgi:hypothetical protein